MSFKLIFPSAGLRLGVCHGWGRSHFVSCCAIVTCLFLVSDRLNGEVIERPNSEPNRPPDSPAFKVLLVHGIDDTGRIFSGMRKHLLKAGYEPLCLDYTPNNGRVGFDFLAQQIGAKIDAVVADNERFAIVGFSMGGLVVRHVLQSGATKRRPEVFVSISSPHEGTLMAWTRWNEGGRQMRRGSPFLNQLRERLPSLQGTRLVTIRTPLDLVILPSTSSLLPGAENHSVPVLLHPLMVHDRRVLKLLVRTLAGSLAAAPGSSDPRME